MTAVFGPLATRRAPRLFGAAALALFLGATAACAPALSADEKPAKPMPEVREPKQIAADVMFNAAIPALLVRNTTDEDWKNVKVALSIAGVVYTASADVLKAKDGLMLGAGDFTDAAGAKWKGEVEFPLRATVTVTLPDGQVGQITQNFAAPAPRPQPPTGPNGGGQ